MLPLRTWPWYHPPKHRKIRVEHQQKRILFSLSSYCMPTGCYGGQSQESTSSFTLLFWQTTSVQITEYFEFMLVKATLDPEDSIPLHPLAFNFPRYILFNSIPRVLAGQEVGFIKMSFWVPSSQSLLLHSTLTNYTPALIAYSWGKKEVPMTKVDGYQVYQDNHKYLEGNLTARPFRKYQ